METVLVTRTDNDGDALLARRAIRVVAATAGRVVLLVEPSGEQAARILPAVHDVLVWQCPWSGFEPPAVDAKSVVTLIEELRVAKFHRALVLTSYHQSPLPMALLLRLAGVREIAAASEDYPGSLLVVRAHHSTAGNQAEKCGVGIGTGVNWQAPEHAIRKARE